MKGLLYLLFISQLMGCVSSSSDVTIATINNKPIFQNEVDSSINNLLFEELDKIYGFRKGSLDNIISQRLIEFETKRSGLSVSNYFSSYFEHTITNQLVLEEIYRYKYDSLITGQANGHLCVFPINSHYGKQFLIKDLKQKLVKQLFDSLKKQYNVQYFLTPPLKQTINTKNCLKQTNGNFNSKVTFTVISSFDCKSCIEISPAIKAIFDKYKSQVKFEFIYFEPIISLKTMFAEVLEKNGADYNIISKLYIKTHNSDTSAIFEIIDDPKYHNNFVIQSLSDTTLKRSIKQSMDQLSEQGISKTPSFLINNRLISSFVDGHDLEKVIISTINDIQN